MRSELTRPSAVTEPLFDLRAGEWVEVKSPAEIAQTLDENGTLDGLPFMPEMLEQCGRRFRVVRRAEKTCIEIPPGGAYLIREFHRNDVVLLDELRCSGSHHDGCQRDCMMFWKKAWLRRVENPGAGGPPDVTGYAALASKLKTMVAPNRYFCQSTELIRATKSEPMTHTRMLAKCVRDVVSGGVGLGRMLSMMLVPLYRKTRDRLIGGPRLLGNLKRTPVGTLNLKPGELVEVKPLKEMQATLDERGRNRGLVCDLEMGEFSGRKYRVRGRLERMISEPTGEMRKVEATVMLDGSLCGCGRTFGGCPRMDYCYWREVWLNRAEQPAKPESPAMRDLTGQQKEESTLSK